MYYPDLGCRLAMIRLYEWRGRKTLDVQQTFIKKVWYFFGAFNLFYQNLGLLIDLWMEETGKMRMADLIAQISETCSVMGLTLVGTSYMWMLVKYRNDIESMLNELEQLYSQHGQLYRIEHYYNHSSRLMKYATIFFLFAYAYYNSLPIVELIYELLVESEHFRYKTQSNTWYPWQLLFPDNCILNFVASYICQGLSSLSGVAAIMTSQYLLCFFATQMQLHFDALANAFSILDARQPEANEQLQAMIAYHCRLLSIANHINRVFNFMFLSTFATSTIAICLMGFAMVMINVASAFKYSVGLLTFLVFTFFICYNGTQFTSAVS